MWSAACVAECDDVEADAARAGRGARVRAGAGAVGASSCIHGDGRRLLRRGGVLLCALEGGRDYEA